MQTGLDLQPAAHAAHRSAFDPLRIRKDFPILHTRANGKPLVYLDNGATTQKPQAVIDAVSHYYEAQNANIHRGVYQLSQLATKLFDQARQKVAAFINAGDPAQVIFTRGTTDGINLVASSWGRTFLKPGDEIIISAMEHHANIVPWQIIAQATGAVLRVIPMNDAGELQMDAYERLLGPRTKFVSVTQLSNALGTINDAATIVSLAHKVGAKVLIDGAQWVAHYPTDVRALDADFYVFSGHKLFGPTGIGILYGRRELLDAMPPYQAGGDMIESVTFEKTTFAPLPNKFEAGTPDIAGAVGLGAAIDYLTAIGFDGPMAHEEHLLAYATREISAIPGVRIVGTAARKGSVISFVVEDPPIASLDLGTALDRDGIALRTGHHCCQPVMDRMKISSTTRASFAMYNTTDDVDALVASLQQIVSEARAKTSSRSRDSTAVAYPERAAVSPRAAADELEEDFEMLGDQQSRNQYVLDLGDRLPHYFDLLKKATPRVPGCMSEVYLVARQQPGSQGVIEFVADANADIVRGLIALLQRLFSGQPAADVLDFNVEQFFTEIGLDQFISSQRRNGLAGMVARIRREADAIARA